MWGSTYLSFRLGVGPGGGFEPFMMGALRFLPSAAVLMGYALLTRQRLRLERRELLVMALSGVVLWVGGNGLILIASQYSSSGYAALMVATTPIWAATFEAILNRKAPSPKLVAGLLLGLVGVVVLSVPKLAHSSQATLLAVGLLLLSPMLWSAGTLFYQRNQSRLEPVVVSAYQQLFGGLAFLLLSPLLGERWTMPTLQGWLALAYLIVFGSLLAYTSFILAVKLLPVSLVTTYAYVNPVVALFLGWLVLDETIGLWTIAGATLVLIAVGVVFQARKR
ncbi:EamA family transporter [Calidithermus timidus]|uniref:EamA family transporter n=1 Tax=Calidithermus timidus TaxID=307124 RepID=UPI00037E2B20|nr:EamA family transporter [Calidithermus timidus]